MYILHNPPFVQYYAEWSNKTVFFAFDFFISTFCYLQFTVKIFTFWNEIAMNVYKPPQGFDNFFVLAISTLELLLTHLILTSKYYKIQN